MEQDTSLSREDVIPFWNAAVYGVSFYVLGFGLLKAALIMPLVFACVALKYGSRWVLRAGFGVLVLAVLLWIGVLPPVHQWQDLAERLASWTIQSASAER